MKITSATPIALAMLVSLGAILPAGAATTAPYTTAPAATTTAKTKHTAYYIARKATGLGCEVVHVKPATKMRIGKHSYKTESAAAKAMASEKACKA